MRSIGAVYLDSFQITFGYRNRSFVRVISSRGSTRQKYSVSFLALVPVMHRARLSDLAAKLWRRSHMPAIHRRSIAGRDLLVYGPDVAAARRHGLPIVALESTIITHGMPYPDNLNTALKVENVVRRQVRIAQSEIDDFYARKKLRMYRS